MCASGLHASVKLMDALQYAPGGILCRVRCSGTVVRGDDKLICSRREILWRVDARDALREFARLCALRAARVHAAKACEAAGMSDHAKTLRALPDNATLMQIERAAQDAAREAAWTAGPPHGPQGPPHGKPHGPQRPPHGTHGTPHGPPVREAHRRRMGRKDRKGRRAQTPIRTSASHDSKTSEEPRSASSIG